MNELGADRAEAIREIATILATADLGFRFQPTEPTPQLDSSGPQSVRGIAVNNYENRDQ